MPIGAWADQYFIVNGIMYAADDGTAMMYSGNDDRPAIDPSTEGSVTIPAEIVGPDGITYKVIQIHNGAFYVCNKLAEIHLPNTFVSIDNNAFYGCTSLTSLEIPSSVHRISGSPFQGCSSLTTLIIPESVTEINNGSLKGTPWYESQPDGLIYKDGILFQKGQNTLSGSVFVENGTRLIASAALSGNKDMLGLTLPSTVTHICSWAISDNGMQAISLPNSLLSIDQSAMRNNDNLKSIFLPSSYGCDNLESIVVASDNPCFDSRNNCNAIIQKAQQDSDDPTKYWDINPELIVGCKTTIIPDEVVRIGRGAFLYCSGLVSIEIPHSVKYIMNESFAYCNNLKTVKLGKNVAGLASSCFTGCSALTGIYSYVREPFAFGNNIFSQETYINATLYVPTGLKEKYMSTDGWRFFWNITERDDLLVPHEVGETFKSGGMVYTVTSQTPLEVVAGTGKSGVANSAIADANQVNTITSVTIPATVKGGDNKTYIVTGVANYAFYNCSALMEVISKIENPQDISSNAFRYSTQEQGTLYVPKGTMEKYMALDGWKRFRNIRDAAPGELATGDVFTVNGMTFKVTNTLPLEVQVGDGTPGTTAIDKDTEGAVIIPATVIGSDRKEYNVTSLGDYAFKNCRELTSITIGVSVKSIGNYAFEGCEKLTEIISLNEIPYSVTQENFFLHHYGGKPATYVTEKSILRVPASSVAQYKAAEVWKEFLGITSVDQELLKADETFVVDGITYEVNESPLLTVDVGVWYEGACDKNRSGALIIPATVTGTDGLDYSVRYINGQAFSGCSNITSVTLPETLVGIGPQVFSGLTKLKSIVIPKNMQTVWGSAFIGCDNLTSIVVDKDNTYLDSRNNCNAIITTKTNRLLAGCVASKIPDNVVEIGSDAFVGRNITSIVIPNSVKIIGEYAFGECFDLESVTFGNSIESIDEDAFYYCKKLKSINIPRSVTNIDISAFTYCSSLASITVEEGNTKYDSRNGCNAIINSETDELIQGCVNAVIPKNVKSIAKYAFLRCSGLTSITIPSSVTAIGNFAFRNCEDLKEVYSMIETPFAISEMTFQISDGWHDSYTEATLYVPANTKSKYEATEGWKEFKNIVEMTTLNPIDGETSVTAEELGGQDLSDNVIGDIYYNVGNDGYDATDGSIVIGQTTNMGQISNSMPGSEDVVNNFTGLILNVAAGQGTIKVKVKTVGNAQLVVQIGNDTPMIASQTEQGEVVINYDVAEDTYVYIYAIIGSSTARMTRVATTDEVRIYSITVSPDASGISNITHDETVNPRYYTLDGKPLEKLQKGLNIVVMQDGTTKKVVVK